MKLVLHHDRAEQLEGFVARKLPGLTITCCTDYASLPGLLESARPDVLFTVRFAGTPNYPRAAILDSSTLRWVAVGGSGTDHLGIWDPGRLTVTNTAGVAADTMAQYALAAMLVHSLGLPAFGEDQRARRWMPRPVGSLRGKTLAIVGLGRTGRAVAGLAKSFGLNVIGTRANPGATPDVDRVEPPERLEALLNEADFVLLALPLTARTRGLFGEATLRAIKRGAVLIDVSRGGILEETALVAALSDGHLGGAVLDVFETEPLPAESPLWALPNVLLTPHCSSLYDGWEERSIDMFCANVGRWQRGLPLDNVVDPNRGY